MYETGLVVHSALRLVVVLLLLLAVLRGLGGWFGNRPWRGSDGAIGLLAVLAVDVQLVLGFLLYFAWSPVAAAARSDMGAAMKDPVQRYWAVEHLVAMLLAITFVHLARVMSKKASVDRARHRWMAIFCLLALVMIAARSPWPWFGGEELERPLLRTEGL